MKFRASLAFVILATASACTNVADGPTGVAVANVGGAAFERGVKPPPPLGTEDTEISIFADLGGEFPSALRALSNRMFEGTAAGRYFANTQSTNGWIQFESTESVTASNGARLQYNEQQGRTNGRGTLTDSDGDVLDLARVQISFGSFFGPCPEPYSEGPYCAEVTFTYDGIPGGTLRVSRVFTNEN